MLKLGLNYTFARVTGCSQAIVTESFSGTRPLPSLHVPSGFSQASSSVRRTPASPGPSEALQHDLPMIPDEPKDHDHDSDGSMQ